MANGLRWLKRNWIVGLLLVSNVVAISWTFGRTGTPEESVAPPEAVESAAKILEAPTQTSLQESLRESLAREQARLRRQRDAPKSDIEKHLEALQEDLEPDDHAARLCALGNLYQLKEQDYETAASYYEEALRRYPDWSGIAVAYHQLISCYTRLSDYPSLRRLYRRMLDYFPEGSTEYDYANSELAGEQ